LERWTIIAAVVTSTPDVFNMMLFAVPMVALFYIGILAGHILALRREGRTFPWRKTLFMSPPARPARLSRPNRKIPNWAK